MASTVAITLTDVGYPLDHPSLGASALAFTVRSASGRAVTEAELMSGEKSVAEKENLTLQASTTFATRLAAESSAIACPGGSGAQSFPLTVTAA